VDYRFAEGKPSRIQPLAKELVALQPDVIVAQSPSVVIAVQRETRVIPTVFVDVADPIGFGFVASLARPGGNLTGLLTFEAGIIGKWLAMLKEIAPGLVRVALVGDSKTGSFDYFQRAAAAAAPSLGIELVPHQVETASDISRAIESFARVSNGGLDFFPDATLNLHRDLVTELAARPVYRRSTRFVGS
jgi:putative ABC transport system substrate-binding protein